MSAPRENRVDVWLTWGAKLNGIAIKEFSEIGSEFNARWTDKGGRDLKAIKCAPE